MRIPQAGFNRATTHTGMHTFSLSKNRSDYRHWSGGCTVSVKSVRHLHGRERGDSSCGMNRTGDRLSARHGQTAACMMPLLKTIAQPPPGSSLDIMPCCRSYPGTARPEESANDPWPQKHDPESGLSTTRARYPFEVTEGSHCCTVFIFLLDILLTMYSTCIILRLQTREMSARMNRICTNMKIQACINCPLFSKSHTDPAP